MIDMTRPAQTLQRLWKLLSPLPFGRRILSLLFGTVIPYSGSISPQILELAPGLVRVQMRDRRRVRNHLHSVHAIALANLLEACTGLAATIALPGDRRAIVTGLNIEYLKKARGTLTGICRFEVPPRFQAGDLEIESSIENEAGETVARAVALWKVAPPK